MKATIRIVLSNRAISDDRKEFNIMKPLNAILLTIIPEKKITFYLKFQIENS